MNLMMRAAAMAPLLAANALWAQLPEGSGKALVETRCIGCHDLASVMRSAYSRTEWLDNVHKMRNVGAKVSDSEMDEIVDYLARVYPERPRPAAVIVPGDAVVMTGAAAGAVAVVVGVPAMIMLVVRSHSLTRWRR